MELHIIILFVISYLFVGCGFEIVFSILDIADSSGERLAVALMWPIVAVVGIQIMAMEVCKTMRYRIVRYFNNKRRTMFTITTIGKTRYIKEDYE